MNKPDITRIFQSCVITTDGLVDIGKVTYDGVANSVLVPSKLIRCYRHDEVLGVMPIHFVEVFKRTSTIIVDHNSEWFDYVRYVSDGFREES